MNAATLTTIVNDLTAAGWHNMALQFAGLAVGPDGSLLVSANGEGSVLHLTPPAR
ncbi:hypothetical protein [Streptomyces sp. NPDC002845]